MSPAAGADMADILRSVVGPGPVAQLESLSYALRDTLYRTLPDLSGTGPAVTWSTGGNPAPEVLFSTPTVSPVVITPDAASMSTPVPSPTASPDVASAPPQIGWQAYGPARGRAPLLARALIMVDSQRSYAGVALVRMDLSQLQLHMMAGFIEPAHPSGIDELIPDLGMIPPADQGRLIAAFNGGFKAVHGHYGMMLDQITLLPPVDGAATVSLYEDGRVRIGAWGREIVPSPGMLAFRQNCPPLIEQGQLNPGVATNARKAWGLTNNADITWRTGVGLSQDGRFLIYAVGNGTSVEFLAQALQDAGAYNALQLDINQYYSHFVTYSPDPAGNGLVAQRLLDQMINIPGLYLTPNPRDFFYLTLRP
jgi:hypothetical protein